MNSDDPKKPEFASWRSYQEFARRVRHARRYVWTNEIQAFLDTVLNTLKERDIKIPQGSIFYRAQRGIDYDPITDEEGNGTGEEPHGFGADRMKPLANRAMEGRINPAGIPVLYLGSTEQTAISEIRPWVGSEVSVAQFRVTRDLRAVNLSLGHGQMSFGQLTFAHLLGEEMPTAEIKEKAVWIDIDNAFSWPITLSDDAADYVPTQILAELFKDAEYDAIVYRSQFGEKGYNIALFSAQDAEAINCAPYRLTSVEVKFTEIGNRWFS
ncbi:MAG: RES family NAD+ phosphorylase, partial [Rhizobiales bacterium]|nr:RES family NAD+ phosphorylase [Hyphomicrobiales bacterium]